MFIYLSISIVIALVSLVYADTRWCPGVVGFNDGQKWGLRKWVRNIVALFTNALTWPMQILVLIILFVCAIIESAKRRD